MKNTILFAALALASAVTSTATAQSTPPGAHAHPAATSVPAIDALAQPAVAVVDRFGQALSAGDFATVETLLDPSVLILESGGAERSRDEYLGHHAKSDAKFLAGTHKQLVQRKASVSGELAWVGSESELHASKDGKPLTLLSTETMVLKNTPEGWRIVHIHWSSRPKR